MTRVALGSGGEFDRIRAIVDALGDAAGAIGDDSAAIPDAAGTLVVSVDASVEDVHFRCDWLTLEEIGWRATASALSDLAATAASPVGVTAAVTVPRNASQGAIVDLMRGVGEATLSFDAKVFGGDLTSGNQWVVVITVFGRAIRRMSRVGARPGDGLWLTGNIGGARSALQAWMTATEPDPDARNLFAHPIPRVAAAQWLARRGATAMMDLSDGLGGDAEHLATASGVRIEVELERVPLHPSVAAAALLADEVPEVFAAIGGEDYELLLTLPAGFDDAAAFERDNKLTLTRIGRIVEGAGLHATLKGVPHSVQGFRHPL